MTLWHTIHFFCHPIFLQHLEGISHPENPQRLEIIIDYLNQQKVWDKLTHHLPEQADIKWIKSNHDEAYVESLLALKGTQPCVVDGGDTVLTARSVDAALHAAGAAIGGVDLLMSGKGDSVFCAVRPPGHHAEFAEAMGFCLFNNVAIAARYAMDSHNAKRVFIFDWDVHHGNGTHYSFDYMSSVFFASIHQDRLFPATGAATEAGKQEGEGYTLNIPLGPGNGDEEYLTLMQKEILPAIRSFKPDLLILSAGFDAHSDDPLAQMQLSTSCFAKMTTLLRDTLRPINGGKILSVLEGGYNQQNLAESVYAHLEALANSSNHL